MSGLIMLAVSWVSIKTLIISDDEWSGGVIKTCFTMAWCFLYELHFVDLVNFLESAMLCVELMCTFLKALCMCVFCVFFSWTNHCVCWCSSHGKTPSHQWHQMHPMVNCSVERSGTSRQIKPPSEAVKVEQVPAIRTDLLKPCLRALSLRRFARAEETRGSDPRNQHRGCGAIWHVLWAEC